LPARRLQIVIGRRETPAYAALQKQRIAGPIDSPLPPSVKLFGGLLSHP
jgi:hypothetical protein